MIQQQHNCVDASNVFAGILCLTKCFTILENDCELCSQRKAKCSLHVLSFSNSS